MTESRFNPAYHQFQENGIWVTEASDLKCHSEFPRNICPNCGTYFQHKTNLKKIMMHPLRVVEGGRTTIYDELDGWVYGCKKCSAEIHILND